MRIRPTRGMLAGAAALALAVIVGVTLVPNLRGEDRGASPLVLNRIAQKNDQAAAAAAAQMRSKSEASAAAVDSLQAAQERGRADAQESLARFDDSEAGRPDAAPAKAGN
ncbi:MAG TPA: hypothetical protein VEW71_06995 [Allosphingosinicella sp.]|nr:hypothetical protein [Allosphingosinicella sp.]